MHRGSARRCGENNAVLLLLLGEGAIFPEFVMRRVQIPSSKIFLSPDVFLGVITTHQFRWMKMESEHHTSLSLYRPSTKTPFNGDGIRVIIFTPSCRYPHFLASFPSAFSGGFCDDPSGTADCTYNFETWLWRFMALVFQQKGLKKTMPWGFPKYS